MVEVIRGVFLRSFHSPAFYRSLAFRWKGIGAGFMVALTLLDLGPSCLWLASKIGSDFNVETLIERMPDLVFPGDGSCVEASVAPDVRREGALPASAVVSGRNARGGATFVECAPQTAVRPPAFAELLARVDVGALAVVLVPLVGIAAGALFVVALVEVFLKALFLKFIDLFFPRRLDLAGSMRVAAAASLPLALIEFVFSVGAIATGYPKLLPPIPWWAGVLVWFGFALFGLWSVGSGDKASSVTPLP